MGVALEGSRHCAFSQLCFFFFYLDMKDFFFFAFFSRQKVEISKLPAHFYYSGDPISIDLYLSSGKLLLSRSVYIKEVDKLFFNQGRLDRTLIPFD